MSKLNHIELYVENLSTAIQFWDWFFQLIGCPKYQEWSKAGKSEAGKSWWIGESYISIVQTVEQYLPTRGGKLFSRLGIGLNHIAIQVGSSAVLDRLEDELTKKEVRVISRKQWSHSAEESRDTLEFEAPDPKGLKIELIASFHHS